MHRFSNHKGVSLVELMIALVVSSIVLIGVATVYTSSKRAYKIQEEMSRLQENARFGFDNMVRDIRMAGYGGCNPSINSLLNPGPDVSTLYDLQSGIGGYEYTAQNTTPGNDYTITSLTNTGTASDWKGFDWNNDGNPDDLIAELAGNVLVGNDVILIRTAMTRDDLVLNGLQPATSASLVFTTNTGIPDGQIVIISNCNRGDMFQNNPGGGGGNANALMRSAVGNPGNQNPDTVNFSQDYDVQDSKIHEVRAYAYFIGPGASGEPALYRADFSQGTVGFPVEEIVEGVENMQVLYGEDLTPADDSIQPDRYVSANQVADFNNVVSVRISLLIRTPQETNRPVQTSTNRLLGVTDATGVDITNMADRRIRKVFTTTVFLRNKSIYRQAPGAQQ